MADWLAPGELRVGLGCMRLAEKAEETVAAAVQAGITVFDTARAYDGNELLLGRALRFAHGARIATKGGMARPDGAWIPDGRAKAIRADCEASLLCAGRAPHRPLPPPRSGSTDALGHVRSRTRPARRRSAGRASRRLQRQPRATGRGAGARADCGRSARDQPVRRPGCPRRRRRSLRRARDHRDRTLATRRAAQGEPARPARGAGERGGGARRHGGRGRAGLAPRARASRRRHSGISNARDRPLVGASRDARPRSCGTRMHRPDSGPRDAAQGRRRHRAGDGRARRREVARRCRARRTRVPPTQPRRARRLTGRTSGRSRRGARIWLSRGRPRQHVPHPSSTQPRRRDGYALRHRRALHLARHAARAGTGEPRRTPARPVRVASESGGARTSRALSRSACSLRPSRCARSASSSRRPTTRASRPSSTSRSRELRARGVAGVFVAAAAVGRAGWAALLAEESAAAAHLVFDWRPDGSPTDLDDAAAAVARVVSGPVEHAICPHPGGAPTCWCRPPLPGLLLAFARRHEVDPARSLVLGASPAHRTLAAALGARSVTV